MAALVDLIAEHLVGADAAGVERAVFATADAPALAGHLERFCFQQLGAGVASGLFYRSSAGCVAGVELADGRRVVVKAYQARWGRPFLEGVRRVQAHLEAQGFPCPRPLVGPASAGPALAMAEAFVPDPGMRALETADEMKASAQGLADLVAACRTLSEPTLAGHPLRAGAGDLYPTPHNPLFDFSADADAARWIDRLAEAARVARQADTSPPVIVHTDWSARNVRVADSALRIAYDWDSLALVAESVAVGQAAATWRSTGEASDPIAPGVEEVCAFIKAYQEASGWAFEPVQVRAAVGAALWVLCYSARCEHALEAATGRTVERCRARLVQDQDAFRAEIA